MESVDSQSDRYKYTRADMCILRREDYRPPKLASECDEILKNYYTATRPYFGGTPFGRGGRYRTKSGTQEDGTPADEAQAQAATPGTFRPSRPYFGNGPPRRGGAWPPTNYREREFRDDRADWRNVPDDRERDRDEERDRERGYPERGRGRGRYFAPADADRDWRATHRPGYSDRERGSAFGDRERDRGAAPSSLARQRSTAATSTSDAVEQFVPSWEQKRIASETDREPVTPTGGKQRSDSLSERGHEMHDSGRYDDGKGDAWDEDADSSWTRVDSRRTGRKRSESATEWDERPSKGTMSGNGREAAPPVRSEVKPQPQILPARSEITRQPPQGQHTSATSRMEGEPAPSKPTESIARHAVAAGEANLNAKRLSPKETISSDPAIAVDIRAAERTASTARVLSPPSPTGIGAFSIDIAASLLESAGVDAGDDDDTDPVPPQRSAPTRSQFASLFGTDTEKPTGNGFGLSIGIGRGRPLANAAFSQAAVSAAPAFSQAQAQAQPQTASSGISFTDPGYTQALLRSSVRQEVVPSPEQPISAQPTPVKWFYVDPQGTQQGPFESSQMEEWFSANYFYPSLPVRRSCDAQFTQLADWVVRFGTGIFVDRSIIYTQSSTTPSSTVPLPQREERSQPVTAPFANLSMHTTGKPQTTDSSDVLPFGPFAAAALGNTLAVQPNRNAAPVNLPDSDASMAANFGRSAGLPASRGVNQPSNSIGATEAVPLRGFGRGQLMTSTVSNNSEQLPVSVNAHALQHAGNQATQPSTINNQKSVPTHTNPYESIWDAAPDDDSVPTAGLQQMTVGQRDRTGTSTSSGSGRNEPASTERKLPQSSAAEAPKKSANSEAKHSSSAALPPGVVDEPEFDIPFEPASNKKSQQRGNRKGAKEKNKQQPANQSAEQRVPEKAVGPSVAAYESPVVGLVRPPMGSATSGSVASSNVAQSPTVAAARTEAKQSSRPANPNLSAWIAGNSAPKWTAAPPPAVVDTAPTLSAIIEAQRAEEQSAVRRELERQREIAMNEMLLETAVQQSGTAWASRVKQVAPPPAELVSSLATGKKQKGAAASSASSQPPFGGNPLAVVQPTDFPALKPTQASASVDSHSVSATAKASPAIGKANVFTSQQQQNRASQPATSQSSGKQEKREKDKINPFAEQRSSKDVDVLNNFRSWCQTELTKLRVNFDIETFVEYVNTIDADAEVEEYAIECIGESRKADARNFVRSYVERRKQIGLKQVLAKVHDHAAASKPAVETARPEQPQSNIVRQTNNDEGGELVGKKKKNKNQRVDRSLLGYRVQTSRVMVGEIDTGQV